MIGEFGIITRGNVLYMYFRNKCFAASLMLCINTFLLSFFNPFPNDENLDEAKSKEFADDKLNNKNDILVFDRVENIVGKGKNDGYQHFLLFPQCFQKACFPGASKGVIVWEWG